jgi:hypothetical protein
MDTSTPNVSTMAIPRRRVPIRTAQRRVPIRILGALAAILVFTKLLHASLHLEASNLITTSVSKQVNAATLLQNETAAWEFSSNETALLSRSIPVFRSIWNDIQGQECQKIIVDRLSNLQQHLKKLDIFV